MSHRAAIFLASSSLFFFSPLLTRQFSSSTSWPGCTSTPSTQLATTGTSRPSSSPRRLATGARESSGLKSPSVGRPRWLVTMTAAPASSAIWMQGTLARMRVSSVMLPASSCGTLRSARMKTRLPAAKPLAITSEKRRTFMIEAYAFSVRRGADHAHHLQALVGVAPLVVVPGHDLHEGAVQRDAGVGIEHAGAGLAAEVGGHHLVFGVAQHALQGALGSAAFISAQISS